MLMLNRLKYLKQYILDWYHQDRLRVDSRGLTLSGLGPMSPSRVWERCPRCRYLVRGAHDCPATPEKVELLKFLFFRLDMFRYRQTQKQTQTTTEDIRETGRVLQLPRR